MASLAAAAGAHALPPVRPGETRAWAKEWRPFTPPWNLAGTADGGRELLIAYESECFERGGRVRVRERRGSVHVALAAETAVIETEPPGSTISCPAPQSVLLGVRLRRALAGRPVYGLPPGDWRGQGPRYAGCVLSRPPRCAGGSSPEGPVAVPDVTGLSPRDARHVLAESGLHALSAGARSTGLRRVTGESPAPGRPVSPGASVRLRLAGR